MKASSHVSGRTFSRFIKPRELHGRVSKLRVFEIILSAYAVVTLLGFGLASSLVLLNPVGTYLDLNTSERLFLQNQSDIRSKHEQTDAKAKNTVCGYFYTSTLRNGVPITKLDTVTKDSGVEYAMYDTAAYTIHGRGRQCFEYSNGRYGPVVQFLSH
jgi:hypothetical protein